jgi:hypothetical protein
MSNDAYLWPPGNKTFVPEPEPRILIYINPGVLLARRTGTGAIL